MKLISKFLIIIGGIITMSGCYYDKESDLYPNSVCDMSVTTYSQAISKIVTANCAVTGCHVAGAQAPDLSDYSKIIAGDNLSRIRTTTIVNKTMPKGGSLQPCDIKKITKWLDNGAQNN